MLKLEIKLDDEKILKESVYQLDGVYQTIENVFEKSRLPGEKGEDGTMVFYGTGNIRDFASFGKIITWLKKKEWFINNVTKWVWYNSDNGRDDEDFSVEDVLYHYTKKASIM